jgi:hypothetical protein
MARAVDNSNEPQIAHALAHQRDQVDPREEAENRIKAAGDKGRRLLDPAVPRLAASISCPLPDRQLHKYQPAGPRDACGSDHNLLIVHVTRHADRPCRRCCAGLLHLGKR